MALENARRGHTPTMRDVWWELLREAAWVSRRAYAGPPRMGYPIKSAWPEVADEISRWAMAMAELQDMQYAAPEKADESQPSLKQIDFAAAVLEIWHKGALTDYGDKRRMKQAVWMKACGVKDRVVRSKTGMTRQRIHDAKNKAMDDMQEYQLRGGQTDKKRVIGL